MEAAKDTDVDSYEDEDDLVAARINKREIVKLLEAAQSGGLQLIQYTFNYISPGINFLFPYLSFSVNNAVKEFLETAKEEFEEKWKNPYKVSTMKHID